MRMGDARVEQREVEPAGLLADVGERGRRGLVGHHERGIAKLLNEVDQQHALAALGGQGMREAGRDEGGAGPALA